MKNKLWIRILVPVLIVAVIGGIWMIKNITDNPTDNASTSQGGTAFPDNLKDADFSLRETEAVDFAALSKYGLPIIVDYGADTCIGCTDPDLAHCSSHTRNAVSYLHRHYFENISLSEVAASLNISPGYLSRIFKSETGSNLVDYLSALRLSKARTLLEDPNLSVQEVAQRVGFNSSNYFIKVFRAQMGETPVQYQNRCRGIDLPTAEE